MKKSTKFIIIICIVLMSVFFIFKIVRNENITQTNNIEDGSTYIGIDEFEQTYKGADEGDPNNVSELKTPIYYQEEYENITYLGDKLSHNGNFVTSMAMIYSTFSTDKLTPDMLLNKYSNLFNDMPTTKKEIMKQIATDTNIEVKEMPFDLKTAGLNVINDNLVLIHIPNPSMYSETSTYLLITGISDDQNMIIRDPLKSKVARNEINRSFQNESIYSTSSICEAIGNKGKMYIFGSNILQGEEK